MTNACMGVSFSLSEFGRGQLSELSSAFICEGIRTPIGRYGGASAQVRTDDLAAFRCGLAGEIREERLGNDR